MMTNAIKNILVIDDLRSFKPYVVENHTEWKVVYARTSQEGLDLLKNTTLDYFHAMFFDHDLGLVGEKTDTTIPCAEFMEELAYGGTPYDTKVFIHTSNSVGRETLSRALRKYHPVQVNADTLFHLDDQAKDQVINTTLANFDITITPSTPKE